MARLFWCGLAVVVFGGLAAAEDTKPAAATGKDGLARLKKLAGTWVAADDKGQPTDQVVSVFKVTSAGSAVSETIFPGSDHEMVSIYHLDGNDLVMTHYCALGNQPKMKLDSKGKANEFVFMYCGGTNIDPAKDMHMHEGKITVIDDDHIEWSWQGFMDGKADGSHGIAMKLVRKK
jgi:hypothetical protein